MRRNMSERYSASTLPDSDVIETGDEMVYSVRFSETRQEWDVMEGLRVVHSTPDQSEAIGYGLAKYEGRLRP